MPNQKPILFSAPMVRAILDRRKTQTRRICQKVNAYADEFYLAHYHNDFSRFTWASNKTCATIQVKCPYRPGDVLWVRETTIIAPRNFADADDSCIPDNEGYPRFIQYLATHPDTEAAEDYGLKKTPSIFMPRWAARIFLKVTNVRVERVKDISEEDAKSEGAIPQTYMRVGPCYVAGFLDIWEAINLKRGFGWEVNPWVWVYEFEKVEASDAESK